MASLEIETQIIRLQTAEKRINELEKKLTEAPELKHKEKIQQENKTGENI